MFLREKALRKLLKQAYKGGLVVGNTGKTIYLSGWCWELEILREHLPKEILAQIIELTGELPEEGECFSATSEGNQMEARDTEGMTVAVQKYSVPLRWTRLLFHSGKNAVMRIYQNQTTNKIVLIHENYLNMVSSQCIQEMKGETEAMGPLYAPGEGIFWKNNIMTFKVFYGEAGGEEEEELIKKLEGQQLWN